MHISEGVLPGSVLALGTVATGLGVAVGLNNIKDESLPKVALLSAGLFLASLIQVPLGPTSIHLLLNGIAGILLGWKVFVALLVVLFLQAILFQFGGITVLGTNVFLLAGPAVVIYYLAKLGNNLSSRWGQGIIYFVCGGGAVVLTTILLAGVLWFTGQEFQQLARVVVVSYLPLAVIEGVITSICLLFIERVKPELLEREIINDK